MSFPSPLTHPWADRLGVSSTAFSSGAVTVVSSDELAQRGRLIGYAGPGGSVVLAPTALAGRLHLRHPVDEAALLTAVTGAEPGWTDLVYGLAPADLLSSTDSRLRRLGPDDAAALAALNGACSNADRALGEVELDHPVAVGLFENGRLLAAASLIVQGDQVADVGVLTHPEARGRGLGALVVAELCRLGLEMGHAIQYTTQQSNVASQRLAERVGLKVFLTEFGVRVKP